MKGPPAPLALAAIALRKGVLFPDEVMVESRSYIDYFLIRPTVENQLRAAHRQKFSFVY
jgi:hypothetical protein